MWKKAKKNSRKKDDCSGKRVPRAGGVERRSLRYVLRIRASKEKKSLFSEGHKGGKRG